MNAFCDLIDEMSKSELRELEYRLAVIVEHLLKLSHVKGQIGLENARGWSKTVRNQRIELDKHIGSNPGLKSKLLDQEVLQSAYGTALRTVQRDYPTTEIPRACPFAIQHVVGDKIVSRIQGSSRAGSLQDAKKLQG